MKYDMHSMKAEEFINDEEIRATVQYAQEHKNDLALIDDILERAKKRKGLSHRDASVLLACEDEGKIKEIYDLAEQIKKDFYGNRIVLFAPLYLSNYCVNGCLYCPYHLKNKHIPRKKLTQEEVAKEVIALQDMGHKRLAIEAGEDPVNNPIEYILDCIKTIYSIKHKNGAIRRVNVNIAATTVENYRKPGSVPTSCSRRPITRITMKSCIRQDPSMTMHTIRKRWTARWKAASMMWASAFCSDWTITHTSSQGS